MTTRSRLQRIPSTLPAAALAAVAVFAACRATPPEELDLWTNVAAGVKNESLARLCETYWETYLRAHPIEATYLGDPRHHGELPQLTERWKMERTHELEDQARRAQVVAAEELDAGDSITLEMLVQEVEKEKTRLALELDHWSVDPIEGPHVRLLSLTEVQPFGTEREREQLVDRWMRIGNYIRQFTRDLRRGKADGLVASRTAVLKSIAQLDAILETSPYDSPLVSIATGGGEWIVLEPEETVSEIAHEYLGDAREQTDLRLLNLHLRESPRQAIGTRVLLPAKDDPLSVVERGRFLYETLTAVEREVYPAFTAYRNVLENELLPAARDDERPGLAYLPEGEATYRALIREHLSLPAEECDPQAIHEFGLAEVARIRAEIANLGERVFGTRDVSLIQERLRNDPAMHFESRAEVEAKAVQALSRARDRMADYFGILPRSDCEVIPIPAYEEQDTTIAYYRGPAPDGSRPGRYFINTYRPETRPRYEAEVLAYHEAIPGHHLQIAIAQELVDIPAFRRHVGSTAFVEGWALYVERLCDEMGLYDGDLDRMGMLSFDAWRACRLVVDTGLHRFGWSRQEAIDYLYENTLLARNNVENEVDRYIAWPGQALAYKIGQREILSLRDLARERLGSRFSYPEFHDRVLQNGAVSLQTLRGIVHRWLDGQAADRPVRGEAGS